MKLKENNFYQILYDTEKIAVLVKKEQIFLRGDFLEFWYAYLYLDNGSSNNLIHKKIPLLDESLVQKELGSFNDVFGKHAEFFAQMEAERRKEHINTQIPFLEYIQIWDLVKNQGASLQNAKLKIKRLQQNLQQK